MTCLRINGKEVPLVWADTSGDDVELAFDGTKPKDIPELIDLLVNQNEFTVVGGSYEKEYKGYNTIMGISFWSHVGYVVATLVHSVEHSVEE